MSYPKWFKRLVRWLYYRIYFPEPGIHVQTIINMKFKSSHDRREVQKLFDKYEAIRVSAMDQMKAKITDMGIGEWEERNECSERGRDDQ